MAPILGTEQTRQSAGTRLRPRARLFWIALALGALAVALLLAPYTWA